MELNLKGMSLNTVAVTDFQQINATLAKVIIATTGKISKQEMTDRLVASFKGYAAPVAGSFRLLQSSRATGTAAHVGFVSAVPDIRQVTDQELQASFKVMATSNILMSAEDGSLWEKKKGAGGNYLVKHGHEDLSTLVSAATNHRAPAPKLAKVAMSASAAQREFISYVTPEGEADYGFVVRTSERNQCVEAAVMGKRGETVIVANALITGIYNVDIPSDVKEVVAANIPADCKERAKAYWRTLFSYSPDYAEKLVKMVEDGASL